METNGGAGSLEDVLEAQKSMRRGITPLWLRFASIVAVSAFMASLYRGDSYADHLLVTVALGLSVLAFARYTTIRGARVHQRSLTSTDGAITGVMILILIPSEMLLQMFLTTDTFQTFAFLFITAVVVQIVGRAVHHVIHSRRIE